MMRGLQVVLALVAGALVSSAFACKRGEPASIATATAVATTEAVPLAPEPPNPLTVITSKKSMADALLVASPLMVDRHNESSLGTLLFAAWSTEHLRWADVGTAKDETSYGAIQKDIDAERMKRLSITGSIIEIAVEKSAAGKWYVGLMQNYGGDLFHFHAVRSTSDLVKGSTGKLYGVVTGWYDYDNSGGGVGHAADIVGMFSLPENRALK
jgi:hypothetical protein